MGGRRREWLRDLLLRGAGITALAASWLAMRWLFGATGAGHALTPLAFVAAASGFLCFSIGTALTALGDHLLDQIEVSQRWASVTRRGDERTAAHREHETAPPPSVWPRG